MVTDNNRWQPMVVENDSAALVSRRDEIDQRRAVVAKVRPVCLPPPEREMC
jgi:hypothetical protein